MTKRSVFQAIVIAVGLLVVADLIAQHMALNSVPRQVIQRITYAPATIDVLGIGNSLIAAGFDPIRVERVFTESGRPCVAVNGGLGATGVIEHLALARLAFRDHAVKTVIYGFFDLQLSSDIIEKTSDIIGNHNMLYYQEPQLTLQYAAFDMLEWFSFQVYRRSALLRERSSVWEKVEKLRREMGSVGMPRVEINRFGATTDFSLLEAKDSRSFELACQNVIRSGKYLSAPIRALLKQAQEHGAKVIVVEMPMHPLHRERFYAEPIWEELRSRTQEALESAGAGYLNASSWIPESSNFDDHLHLSRTGARRFSELLASQLIQQPN